MIAWVEEMLNPRKRFGDKEAFDIAAISPMTDVPERAVPDPNSRLQPPVFHFGWVLDIETCREIEMLRRISQLDVDDHSDGATKVLKDDAYWMSYLGGDEYMSEEQRACIQASLNTQMVERVASDLMKDLSLWDLSDDDFLQLVFAPTPGKPNICTRLALSIGDNYHLDELPSTEVLAKIKAAFHFEVEAGWFMDALDTAWVQY